MPSTYAHRRFGADVLVQLPRELREKITPYRPLYDMGLHGPDLMFYYRALQSNPVNRLGNAMHEQPGRVFFTRARGVVNTARNKNAALAYALGFVCHFALDSTCHPYVERYTRESGVSHCEIETEFDNQLMREDGLDPMHFFTAGHIRPNREFAKIIAPFYENVTADETYGAMRGMVRVHHLLQATSPVKRWVVLTALKAAGTYDVMHGLVANLQPNPRCEASDKELEALYQQALPLVATLIPIFFNALAEGGGLSSVEYLAYWGYAASAVTVITAVLSPILGTLADTRNFKKPIFTFCVAVGVIGCCAMGMASTWLPFLLIFIFAKVGFSGSLVFYDSMLSDVTVPDRMDEVSSKGYAWGYIGSCVPFVVCLALVLGAGSIGISQMTALNLALFITAVWWLVATLPLLRQYKQVHFVEVQEHAIRQSFARIGHTLRHLKEDRQVFWFLLAFFCYIDGVYTIIDMATAYGTALGLDTTGLLLALLVTQIVAFPSALVFGRLSGQYPSGTLIPVCIAAYAGIAVFAFFLKHQWQFWVLAVVVGMFQGGIQALSRSHFAKIIPPEKSGEYFGLFDICGKGASFLGTMIVSVGSQLTGSANVGVGSLIVLFIVGFVLFRVSDQK